MSKVNLITLTVALLRRTILRRSGIWEDTAPTTGAWLRRVQVRYEIELSATDTATVLREYARKFDDEHDEKVLTKENGL
jgi:hypothetical protein